MKTFGLPAWGISRFTGALACAISVAACNGTNPKPADLYSMGEWRDALKGNGNWHIVGIPDSKIVPGSIVKITEKDGLSWIDSLQSCGIPADRLVARKAEDSQNSFVVLGASPEIKFTKKVEFNANVLLNIAGVKAGPEFSKVRTTVLTIGDNGGDALRLLALSDWIQKNPASYSKACDQALKKPDHYLVSESFRFSSATYSLYDESGAKIAVTVPTIGKLLQLEPTLGVKVTGDGDLVINKPMYVAVRRAIAAGDGFDTLAKSVAPSGDARLETHNNTLK